MTSLIQLTSIDQTQKYLNDCQNRSDLVAFIPTMGNLHDGHLSLVQAAKSQADRTIVSIYINPLQFSPNEDFGLYPRTLASDLEKLSSIDCDAVFLPTNQMMHPNGIEGVTSIVPRNKLVQGLCATLRPHFFGGVATVIMKLFSAVPAKIAFFGEKDYQQLLVIKHMVKDFNLPIKVIGAPTVREADGLAMSSRNMYLSEQERAKAPLLHAQMQRTAGEVSAGGSIESLLNNACEVLKSEGFVIDYFEIRTADQLEKVTNLSSPVRLFAAAYLGKTRLIDNISIN